MVALLLWIIFCIALVKGGSDSDDDGMFPDDDPSSSENYLESNASYIEPFFSPSYAPTRLPSLRLSLKPTNLPSIRPTVRPTVIPTKRPSPQPTTLRPSNSPTIRPTRAPTVYPTARPFAAPTQRPTRTPSVCPSKIPSRAPTSSKVPTTRPTSAAPTRRPVPSVAPSLAPTACPAGSEWTAEGTCVLCKPGTAWNSTFSSCLDCLPGFFSDGYASVTCNACSSGLFSGLGSSKCSSKCPDLTYIPFSGSSACLLCPPGYVTRSDVKSLSGMTMSDVCSPCQGGNFSDYYDQRVCRRCPAGFFSGFAAASCTPCPAGNFNGNQGSPSCAICPVNTYSATAGSTRCTACEVGTFNLAVGGTSCDPCAAGKYYSISQKVCVSCDAGKYNAVSGSLYSSSCSVCIAGKFSLAGASQCSNCVPGSYSAQGGATSCKLCNKGTYSNSFGVLACSPCSAGKFQPQLGANSSSACRVCESGTVAPSPGSSACDPCSAGKYSVTNTATPTQCSSCPVGQYSDVPGSSSCSSCPLGTYNNIIGAWSAYACRSCSAGSVSYSGQSACLSCPSGSFASSLSTCSVCSPGTYSVSGSSVCSPCAVGMWQGRSNSSYCNECPAGSFSAVTGSSYCTQCEAGQYSGRGSGKCSDCPVGLLATADGLGCTAESDHPYVDCICSTSQFIQLPFTTSYVIKFDKRSELRFCGSNVTEECDRLSFFNSSTLLYSGIGSNFTSSIDISAEEGFRVNFDVASSLFNTMWGYKFHVYPNKYTSELSPTSAPSPSPALSPQSVGLTVAGLTAGDLNRLSSLEVVLVSAIGQLFGLDSDALSNVRLQWSDVVETASGRRELSASSRVNIWITVPSLTLDTLQGYLSEFRAAVSTPLFQSAVASMQGEFPTAVALLLTTSIEPSSVFLANELNPTLRPTVNPADIPSAKESPRLTSWTVIVGFCLASVFIIMISLRCFLLCRTSPVELPTATVLDTPQQAAETGVVVVEEQSEVDVEAVTIADYSVDDASLPQGELPPTSLSGYWLQEYSADTENSCPQECDIVPSAPPLHEDC